MRISYSKVSTYQRCPLKFRLQYVDEVPVEKPVVMHLGNAVHAALKFLHDPRQALRPPPSAVLEEFETHWRAVAADRPDFTARLREGQTMLRRYYRALGQWEGRTVTAVEQWFQFPLDDTVQVVGVIDRVDSLPDRTIELVDYKSGKYLPDPQSLKGDLQFSIYALAARRLYPGRPLSAVLYALQHAAALAVELQPQDLDRAAETIRETVSRVRAEAFPARPGRQCDACEYRPVCPYWAEAEAPASPFDR